MTPEQKLTLALNEINAINRVMDRTWLADRDQAWLARIAQHWDRAEAMRQDAVAEIMRKRDAPLRQASPAGDYHPRQSGHGHG